MEEMRKSGNPEIGKSGNPEIGNPKSEIQQCRQPWTFSVNRGHQKIKVENWNDSKKGQFNDICLDIKKFSSYYLII